MGASASEPCYILPMRRVDEVLTKRARALRNNGTESERLLWLRLRAFRPRFTRQLVIGRYIIDLACREARLAIEVDGGQHANTTAYDKVRTEFLENQGWAVLRLWNNEVLADPDAAAQHVLNNCSTRLDGATHPPAPPFQGGEEKAAALRLVT